MVRKRSAAKKVPARKSAKKVKPFKFQLGLTGLCGLAVVTCCVLFWMFLLGIWAGQSVLAPVTQQDNMGYKTASKIENNVHKASKTEDKKEVVPVNKKESPWRKEKSKTNPDVGSPAYPVIKADRKKIMVKKLRRLKQPEPIKEREILSEVLPRIYPEKRKKIIRR